MKDREHNDLRGVETIEDGIRKARDIGMPHLAMDAPEHLRCPLDRIERRANGRQELLTEAALLSGQDKEEGAERGITLMTVHTAKGLEWPVVVVAGLEDGLFPLARATEAEDTLEEERRLF